MASNNTDIVEQFKLHAARAFFASAWADACDEAGQSALISGKEIMDVMPNIIDPAAKHAAQTLMFDMERTNGQSIADLFGTVRAKGDGDRPNTVESFGHYAAMQAMGHGVGLNDAFGDEVYETIKVPYIEFGSHSLGRDYF